MYYVLYYLMKISKIFRTLPNYTSSIHLCMQDFNEVQKFFRTSSMQWYIATKSKIKIALRNARRRSMDVAANMVCGASYIKGIFLPLTAMQEPQGPYCWSKSGYSKAFYLRLCTRVQNLAQTHHSTLNSYQLSRCHTIFFFV